MLLALTVRTFWFGTSDRARLGGETMGTTWSVELHAPGLARAARSEARALIQRELDTVEGAMSTWDRDSEVSRLNRHRSPEPFALSPATREVLVMAERVSLRSGGAFDVTVRPLVAAWGFGADARLPGDAPDPAELEALRARVGHAKLRLDESGVRKQSPDLEVDLSAIAKGFGVDRVAQALGEAGYRDFLVEVGGELRSAGERPGGGAWRLAIERPEPDGRAVHAVIELSDRALATSGDYRSFYEAGGRRLTHIVDPRTGRPVEHALASVSVVHEQAALADAWATALTVLGPDEGLRVAEAEGLAAYLISRRKDGRYTVASTSSFPQPAVSGTDR